MDATKHEYFLFDRSGELLRQLTGAIVTVDQLGDEEELDDVMSVPDRAGVVPYYRKSTWGLVGANGRVVVRPKYRSIKVVSPTQVLAAEFCKKAPGTSSPGDKCGAWRLLTGRGRPTKNIFDRVRLANESPSGNILAVNDGTCYVYQPNGVVVEIANCTNIKDMSLDGVFAFRRTAVGRWGITDRSGRVLVEPTWDYIGLRGPNVVYSDQFFARFDGGLMSVMTRQDRVEKWGAIDRTGKVVVPQEWDAVVLSGQHVFVERKKLWGLVDRAGKIVVPPRYERVYSSLSRSDDGVFLVKAAVTRNKRVCLLTSTNKEILCGTKGFVYLGSPLVRVTGRGKAGKRTLHNATTGAQVIPDSLHEQIRICYRLEQDKLGVYPVPIVGKGNKARFGLVSTKGPVTAFKYASLDCFHHGLAAFTVDR